MTNIDIGVGQVWRNNTSSGYTDITYIIVSAAWYEKARALIIRSGSYIATIDFGQISIKGKPIIFVDQLYDIIYNTTNWSLVDKLNESQLKMYKVMI